MRGGVRPELALVARRRQDLAVAGDHGPDRHVIMCGGTPGLIEGQAHHLDIGRIAHTENLLRRLRRLTCLTRRSPLLDNTPAVWATFDPLTVLQIVHD